MDILFAGHIFKVVRKFVTGHSGEQLERHVILHPGAVAVIPVLENGDLVLIRQYRVAVDAYLLELPAGTLEPDEPPIDTARRELLEETGYAASSLVPLTCFFSSPGIMREEMHLFLATHLVAGPTNLEDGEDIEKVIIPLEQAVEKVFAGEIKDAKTIIGLLWYARRRAAEA